MMGFREAPVEHGAGLAAVPQVKKRSTFSAFNVTLPVNLRLPVMMYKPDVRTSVPLPVPVMFP
jgi:hypothetical protein